MPTTIQSRPAVLSPNLIRPRLRRDAGPNRIPKIPSPSISGLYQQHHQTVYWIAYRVLLCSEEAEDVVQDVFLRLPGILASHMGRGSLEGWIKRVATRTALMQLRKRKRRRETSLGQAYTISRSSLVNQICDRLTLEQAMATLPRGLLVVFVLKEVEGYTHEEIGRRLRIRPGTSKARLHFAKKALQTFLREPDPYRID